jgi:hypothetical protein
MRQGESSDHNKYSTITSCSSPSIQYSTSAVHNLSVSTMLGLHFCIRTYGTPAHIVRYLYLLLHVRLHITAEFIITTTLFGLRLLFRLNGHARRPVRQQCRDIVNFPELPRKPGRVQERAHVKTCKPCSFQEPRNATRQHTVIIWAIRLLRVPNRQEKEKGEKGNPASRRTA